MSLEQRLQIARRILSEFTSDEGGATVIEYGLVVTLIAFANFGIVVSMGESVNTAFTGVNSGLENVVSGMPP